MNISYADDTAFVMALTDLLEASSNFQKGTKLIRDASYLRIFSNTFLQRVCFDEAAFSKEVLQREFSSRNSLLA